MKLTAEGATMSATTPRTEPQRVKGIRKLVTGGALLMIALSTLTADAAQWNGFEQRDLIVDGRKCLLILPNTPAPGKPWIWRMEFFGHEPQGDIALLGKGFHVAYMNVENMYGAPVALDHMDKFHAHLTMQFGLAPKTVLEGFSRGDCSRSTGPRAIPTRSPPFTPMRPSAISRAGRVERAPAAAPPGTGSNC